MSRPTFTLPPLTRQQSRRVDQVAIDEFGLSGLVLMENAGRGAAELIDDLVAPKSTFSILCGGGNNGGDGYVIARHLQLLGYAVRIIAAKSIDQLKGDARANAIVAHRAGIMIDTAESLRTFSDAPDHVILDCLLGTGAVGFLRDSYSQLVAIANRSDAVRIAIDVPTGLDADTGQGRAVTFRADHTITFVAPKVGFTQSAAAKFVGQLHVVPIGVPRRLLEQLQREFTA